MSIETKNSESQIVKPQIILTFAPLFMTLMMKKSIYVILTMLALTAFSCSKGSDDDEVVSDNCYISAFTLGQLRRQINTTSSSGLVR